MPISPYSHFCRLFLFVSVLVGMPVAPLLGQEPSPVDADFCDLIAHSKRYNNERVRTKASVQSVVIEGGSWLFSDSCKQGLVELVVPDNIRKNPKQYPNFKNMDDAIRRHGYIGTVGKQITATFIGTFHSQSKRPKRSFTLEGIENLVVKIDSPADARAKDE